MITFDFDLQNASSDDRARIRSIFHQLGWKSTGGSHWIFLSSNGLTDLFNHVIPALWEFRKIVVEKHLTLTRYHLNLDGHAYLAKGGEGFPLLPVSHIPLVPICGSTSTKAKHSEKKLRRHLEGRACYERPQKGKVAIRAH